MSWWSRRRRPGGLGAAPVPAPAVSFETGLIAPPAPPAQVLLPDALYRAERVEQLAQMARAECPDNMRAPADSDEETFVALVAAELSRLGCSVTRIDISEAVVSGRMRGTVGLLNIQQVCTPLPRRAWPDVISEHLRGLARAADLRLDLRNLAPVRRLLRTRLYDEAGEEAGLLAGRLIAPGLFEALVVDQPSAVHGVPRAVAAGWGEPLEELMALGRAQVLDAGMLTRQHVDLGAAEAMLLEDTSPYTSGHLHWLASYLDVPEEGALVIVPTRHCVLAHALTTREGTLAAAQALLVNAQRLYDEGPGGISPHLYWWFAGTPILVPGAAEPGRIELRPPQEFMDMLATLPD